MGSPADIMVDVCSVEELAASGKHVVGYEEQEILLLWNDGAPVALNNVCIHKQRRLSEGALLNGRVVCPGHQWSFDLRTGYCKERDRFQPRFDVHVTGDRISIAPVPGADS
jgi:nitrite reductase/ring-hydroxylating ferredoxin subunit